MNRFAAVLPVLAVLSLSPLTVGCEGDAPRSASSDDSGTSSVASGMLQSEEQRRQAPPGDTVEIANLGYTLGDSGAPVQIVEFSDFGCGYCRQFHVEVWPTLEREYVESGKVEWQHIPMILGIFGKNADEAAEAALCAREQDGFETVKHRLFVDQGEWKGAGDPLPVLEGFVRDEGLDPQAWRQCMSSDRYVAEVQTGTALSRQVGVRGTPTFFIVGIASIPGMVPLETFRQVLDTVHAQATR